IEGLKQKKTKLILEIKPQKNKETEEQLVKKVIETVNQLNAAPWIEYISFSYFISTYLIENVPGAKVSYLNGEIEPKKLKEQRFYGFDYHKGVLKKNSDWIKQAKNLGLVSNVWTVNSEKELNYFIDQKVNYITTNEPELLFKVLKK